MAHGFGHVDGKKPCGLCGHKDGAKIQCTHVINKHQKQCPMRFHPTCAREAGFDVANDHTKVEMSLMCFSHGRCEYAFRAMLEDMIEFEKVRAGNDLKKIGGSMSLDTATNIFNAGVRVMRCFGWAWQWAESWVHYGDNWEPLLEEGQTEADMSREQLKYVESTLVSRRADARRCRLAAFGAALRNRDYDQNAGDDRTPLNNALHAILLTKSLVGPLGKAEIDFFTEWLGRVYRSKCPLMRLGVDKMPVNEIWAVGSPVFHCGDKSPKYELGARKLPGKQLKKGLSFENIDEVDDYFENEEALAKLHPPVSTPTSRSRDVENTSRNSSKKAKTPKNRAPTVTTKRSTSTKSKATKTLNSNKASKRRKSNSSNNASILGDDTLKEVQEEEEHTFDNSTASNYRKASSVNRSTRRSTNNSLSVTPPEAPTVDSITEPDAKKNPTLEDRIPKKSRRT